MIFQIIQIRNMAKEVKESPSKFASGQAGSMFLDLLIVPALIVLASLIIFFIFGFTSFPSFLGGPYLFFKILFLLTLAAVLFTFYLLRKIYRLIKSVTKNVVESTIEVKSTVVK